MQSIRANCGAAIEAACAVSSVPPEFLAALIANESAGNPNAKRFEKNVLLELWDVLMGRAASFGSIDHDEILEFLFTDTATTVSRPSGWISTVLQHLDFLATSWGLTQIMGYEAIALGVPLFSIQSSATNPQIACRMLADFADRSGLDVKKDFSELFDCWNTGRPHARTADPEYIPNGLARMSIYKNLEDPPKAMSA